MFDLSLVTFTEYAKAADKPHIVIAGGPGAWAPRVRGYDRTDGTEVSLAFYWRDDYETKAEARTCARNLLDCVKAYRACR
jgi:hypothetical protein